MAEFEDVNAAFAAVAQQLAELKGEAAAGRLLAIHALDLILGLAPNPAQVLESLDRRIDATINALYPETDDPAVSRLNAISTEAARIRCQELLDSLRSHHQGRG